MVFKTSERVGFLSSDDYTIHYIHYDSGREFLKNSFTEGQMVWLYLAKEIHKIVSIVDFNNEKIEDMPNLEPIEQ